MFNTLNLQGKNIDGLRLNDSIYLNKEEFTEMSNSVIGVAEEEFTLIEGAFPTVTADPSKKKYNYVTMTEAGEAGIIVTPGDFPALSINGSDADVRIPMKGISFELDRDDIKNSRRLGGKLDTLTARSAVKLVKKLQDEALWSKSSVFGTLGAKAQATGAFSGSNWTTATTNVYDQVRQAILAIPAAWSQDSMVLVLHRDQWGELFRDTLESSGSIVQVTGGSFFAKIKAAFPGLRIIQSQQVTAATGLIYPFNEDVVRRVVSITPRVIDWDENPMSIIMAAIAKDVLVAPTPSALVAISGI